MKRAARVFSRDTRAGNVRGPAVANPSHCERESPVRTKPWPSRRSFLDLRRNGHRTFIERTTKKPLRSGRDPVRRRTGSNPAMLCKQRRRMKTVRTCCPTFSCDPAVRTPTHELFVGLGTFGFTMSGNTRSAFRCGSLGGSLVTNPHSTLQLAPPL